MVAAAPAWTDLPRGTFAIDDAEPHALAQPSTPEALADTLGQATERGWAVAPRGGGTRMGLGNPPERLDLVLNTSGLAGVVEYEPADLTLTVLAGTRFSDVQRTLAEQGQLLAIDPPADETSTIGGIIATNASGPLRFSSGAARDLVIGIRVANADGRLTRAGGRVVKNVAGYDLNKLYVGSLGILGVIVELSFKLAPIPPAHGQVLARLPDAASAERLLSAIVRSRVAPLAVELLGAAAASALDGAGGGRLVALRLGGYEQVVARQTRELAELVVQHGGTRVDTAWESVTGLQAGAARKDVVVKAAVPLVQTAAVVDRLERDLTAYVPLVWARGGNGIAYAAFDAPPDVPGLVTTLTALRGAIRQLGENASLVIERAPTQVKRGIDAWGDAGAGVELMRALKRQLDPRMTLNPGRYVGGI